MSAAILRATKLPVSGPYPTLDPFLFCVYHKDEYPADESGGKMETTFPGNGSDFNPHAPYRMYHGHLIPGFPQHPHRGFETITATMEGLIDHADSVGNAGRYGEGDVQWMTAGGGVVHGEMFPLVHADKPNHLRLFQIWLNLPAKNKMVNPSFAMFWNSDVPIHKTLDEKAVVTVWAGNYFLGDNVKQNSPPPNSWAADPTNDVAVLHITIQPGGTIVIPKANISDGGINRSLYLIEGHKSNVKVDGKVINEKVCLTIDATKDIPIELDQEANEEVQFLLLQGKPIDEPVAQHGPFVMNTQSEIRDAFMDYQRTEFGGWPWPKDDMVFPQDKGRFALIDGKETRPPLLSTESCTS
jgi:redox-sensitive bicupin YhaK (pirin superfamily)